MHSTEEGVYYVPPCITAGGAGINPPSTQQLPFLCTGMQHQSYNHPTPTSHPHFPISASQQNGSCFSTALQESLHVKAQGCKHACSHFLLELHAAKLSHELLLVLISVSRCSL